MPDLVAIVRATRASANALTLMSRHARACAEACRILSGNYRLADEGRITPAALTLSNRIAEANKAHAITCHSRAKRQYDRAQQTLAANPLPGDNR